MKTIDDCTKMKGKTYGFSVPEVQHRKLVKQRNVCLFFLAHRLRNTFEKF